MNLYLILFEEDPLVASYAKIFIERFIFYIFDIIDKNNNLNLT